MAQRNVDTGVFAEPLTKAEMAKLTKLVARVRKAKAKVKSSTFRPVLRAYVWLGKWIIENYQAIRIKNIRRGELGIVVSQPSLVMNEYLGEELVEQALKLGRGLRMNTSKIEDLLKRVERELG